MDRLGELASLVAARLAARGETVAVAESSTGGLICALIRNRRVPLLNPVHLAHLRIDLTDVPEARRATRWS